MRLKKAHKILAIVLIISAVGQLVFLATFKDFNPLDGLTGQSGYLAYNLVQGNGLSSNIPGCEDILAQRESFRNADFSLCPPPVKNQHNIYSAHEVPGYAVMLAGTWLLFGQKKYIYMQIIQVVLSVLSSVAVYCLGIHFFSKKTALVASIITAWYLPLLLSAYPPIRDIWVYFEIVIFFLIYLYTIYKNQKLWREFIILTSVLLGIMSYVHPMLFYFPLFLAISVGVIVKNWKKGAITFITSYAIILLILSPWIYRNYVLFQRFIPTRAAMGAGLWEGMGEFENPIGAVLNDGAAFEEAKKENPSVAYGSVEYGDILTRKAIDGIKKYPFWYLTSVLRRVPKVLFPIYIKTKHIPRITNNPSFFFLKPSFISFATIVQSIIDIIISFLGLAGMWVCRHRWRSLIFFYMIPLYFISILSPVHIEARYVIGVRFISILFAIEFIIFTCDTLRHTWKPRLS